MSPASSLPHTTSTPCSRPYEETGYYHAQGDNTASPNPPAGALLTYYLREDLAAAGGQNGPKMVLTVTDSGGKMVRQLDASNKAGVHRTPWDLRETALQNPQGGAGRGTPPGQPGQARQRGGTEVPSNGGRGRTGSRGAATRRSRRRRWGPRGFRRTWRRTVRPAGQTRYLPSDTRETGERLDHTAGDAAVSGGSPARSVESVRRLSAIGHFD